LSIHVGLKDGKVSVEFLQHRLFVHPGLAVPAKAADRCAGKKHSCKPVGGQLHPHGLLMLISLMN
jgi:hypothetical protein